MIERPVQRQYKHLVAVVVRASQAQRTLRRLGQLPRCTPILRVARNWGHVNVHMTVKLHPSLAVQEYPHTRFVTKH